MIGLYDVDRIRKTVSEVIKEPWVDLNWIEKLELRLLPRHSLHQLSLQV